MPGHWEGDLLLGGARSAIATLVERHSRFVMLVALPDGKRSEHVVPALARQVQQLPVELRRSLTWDQGKEMSFHATFTIDTGVQVYFCDPKSPWQRGSNENTNGLLRQYFPKGKSMTGFPGRPRRHRGPPQRQTPRDARVHDTIGEARRRVALTP